MKTPTSHIALRTIWNASAFGSGLHQIASFRDLIRAIIGLGVEADHIGVALVNRVQTDHQIAWQDAEQLLDHELMAIISPDPDLAFRAAEADMPMILHQPNSVVANQFSRFKLHRVSKPQQLLCFFAEKHGLTTQWPIELR